MSRVRTVAVALGAIAALSLGILAYPIPSSVPLAVAASSDYLLKLDGIEGEIAIDSYGWGVASPTLGGQLGRKQLEPLIIRKHFDSFSPILYRLSGGEKGQRLKKVTLLLLRTGAAATEITFFDVVVDTYRQSGEPGTGPLESVSFTYQKIEWK